MQETTFGKYSKLINKAAKCSSKNVERKAGNIEDQFRIANELLRGLEILSLTYAKQTTSTNELRAKLSEQVTNFANAILCGERGIVAAENNKARGSI